ncbi:MAG: hypothetical protein HYU53_18950 [Acidobacteria bacterium]|nr:hypothetical protein [Acidobacteriota bacterium]
MLTKLCAIGAMAALPLVAACDTRADTTRPVENPDKTAQAASPADSPAVAPDHDPAASADRTDKKPAEGNPISRLFSKEPEYRELTLPAGTVLPVELQTTVASDASDIEDPVRATVRRAVVVDGVEAIPAGSGLSGVVTDATRSGRVKGRARVAFRFNSLEARDERHDVRTGVIARRAPATKKQDAAKIAVGAGAGAVIGGIAGGGDGAAKGAAIGGAGGTGVVLATRGKEVRVPAGTSLNVRLTAPITIRVPTAR